LRNLNANGTFFDALTKSANYGQRNVSVKQCDADFLNNVGNIRLGKLPATTK
jgi:hypothetical protein